VPVSYSQLRLYQTCPRQYEFAVIKKIGRPLTPGESFGSSVHNALRKWGELEMEVAGGDPGETSDQPALFAHDVSVKPAADALKIDTLTDFWHQSFIVDSYATRVEADFDRRRGEELMYHFYDWWRQVPRRVAAVEKGFSIELDGGKLTGRFDRAEEEGDGIRIVDFKTGKSRDQDAVDADLQLSVYALATESSFRRPCAGLTLLFLSEEGVIERQTTRNQSQLRNAARQIHLIGERIESEDFHPAPSVEKCRVCPYRGICDAAASR
jgi:RecB family exonuclease